MGHIVTNSTIRSPPSAIENRLTPGGLGGPRSASEWLPRFRHPTNRRSRSACQMPASPRSVARRGVRSVAEEMGGERRRRPSAMVANVLVTPEETHHPPTATCAAICLLRSATTAREPAASTGAITTPSRRSTAPIIRQGLNEGTGCSHIATLRVGNDNDRMDRATTADERQASMRRRLCIQGMLPLATRRCELMPDAPASCSGCCRRNTRCSES